MLRWALPIPTHQPAAVPTQTSLLGSINVPLSSLHKSPGIALTTGTDADRRQVGNPVKFKAMGGDPVHHTEGVKLTKGRSDLQKGSYFRKPGENSWLKESSTADFKQGKHYSGTWTAYAAVVLTGYSFETLENS